MIDYDNKHPYETSSYLETAAKLGTDVHKGLTNEEAKNRKEVFGENKLKESKQKSFIRIFFEQMKNALIYVLFVAIAITIAVSIYETINAVNSGITGNYFLDVGSWPDVIIIVAVIFLNSLIGAIQEVKANSSLEALKKMASPLVNVRRNNEIIRIKSQDIAIGDILVLQEGDVVGADIRLLASYNLKINESALTGESVPVEKNADIVFSKETPIGDRINMAYSSTIVTYGRGEGIVTHIGMDTEIGKIAHSLSNEKEDLTPLQKKLNKLSSGLGILTLIIVILVFVVSMIWIFVNGTQSQADVWTSALLSSIALAVAAIPEGLVAVVTIVLALGVTRMVKANTIIRKLPSVETLGSVNVICSDKTGTLTQNKMTVVSSYLNFKVYDDLKNHDLDKLAIGLSLCSDATETFGDPTEIALVNFADNLGYPKSVISNKYPRTDELPFDSVRKMMSTKHGDIIYTKGAVDQILKNTTKILVDAKTRNITKEDIDEILKVNKEYANKALRVLALAISNKDKIVEKDLTFVGLVAMIDPPRLEVKDAVKKLKQAGIRTVMITGDHIDTAYAIANTLDIASNKDECLSGADVDKLSFEELKEKVNHVCVFARVSPSNKTNIVKAIKANGLIAAMTGDGVNDAPSLKASDIGIAMGITGTDVAKDAADMILVDDNFASIEKAVEEGRGIYSNIEKTILFLLSSNFAEVITMFAVICIGFPTPLIAIHLLWINLLTDSTPAIALGVDPKDEHVMEEKPRKADASFLSKKNINTTLIYGGIITIGVIIAFLIPAWLSGFYSISGIKSVYNDSQSLLRTAQTMAFTTLAFSELFHMLGMSNLNASFVKVFKNKNKMMYIAFFVGIALQVFVVMTPGVNNVFKTSPLDWEHWVISLTLSLLPLIYHEVVVLIKFIIKKKKKNA